MKPIHVSLQRFVANAGNVQVFDFVLLYQRHQSGCPKCRDGVEIHAKIAVPAAGHGGGLLLTWAKGNADAAKVGLGGNRCNLKGMGVTGVHGSFFAPFWVGSQPNPIVSNFADATLSSLATFTIWVHLTAQREI